MSDDREQGIWLEVEDVRFERKNATGAECKVRLKGDRKDPKKAWWPVAPGAVAGGGGDTENKALEDYRAILRELDKKRLVLARLAAKGTKGTEEAKKGPTVCGLECDAFRFQASELGSR